MKIKVTAIIVLDTDKIPNSSKGVKTSIEREAFNKGSDRISRLWAWGEANKQDIPDISLELL